MNIYTGCGLLKREELKKKEKSTYNLAGHLHELMTAEKITYLIGRLAGGCSYCTYDISVIGDYCRPIRLCTQVFHNYIYGLFSTRMASNIFLDLDLGHIRDFIF